MVDDDSGSFAIISIHKMFGLIVEHIGLFRIKRQQTPILFLQVGLVATLNN
jgi:hypothetical protein